MRRVLPGRRTVRLARHKLLDAVCGEYLLGTLRGGARRRFQRALAQERAVARRLMYWEQWADVTYSEKFAVRPSAGAWKRIRRDLALHRYAPPWYSRIGVWRTWAAVASVAAALLLALGLPELNRPAPSRYVTLAVMQGPSPDARVTVQLSADGRSLHLRAARPTLASPSQSFELWLIPPGQAPQALAVLGTLDSTVELPQPLGPLSRGAKFAVSVEPAGGSPTAGPTGAIIAIGEVPAT